MLGMKNTEEGFELKATLDYVILRAVKQTVSEGGILIPEQAQGNASSLQCKVIAVGPGAYAHGTFIKPEVSVGDYVLLGAPDHLNTFRWRGEELAITRWCAGGIAAIAPPDSHPEGVVNIATPTGMVQ